MIPYVGWCITELGKVQITKVPWVGCKRTCSNVLIVKKENSGRVTLNVEELDEVFILAMNDVYFLCLRQHLTLKIGGGGQALIT